MNGRTRVSRHLRGRQESVWQNACVPWLEGAEAGHPRGAPDWKQKKKRSLFETKIIKTKTKKLIIFSKLKTI